jgi:hypothetical protein
VPYVSWGNWHCEYRWYLTEFSANTQWGTDSFCLHLDQNALHLWANPDFFDVAKISEFLQTPEYAPIIAAFDNPHESHISELNNLSKIVERGNFHFGDPDDGHLSPDKFAWYAHYRTDEVVEQIFAKINRFRTPEITALFEEINRKTKKPGM